MENMRTKKLMTPGDFEIRKNKKKESRTLLTPAYFSKLYKRVSKPGEKEEYIPRMIRPCQKCENVRRIKGNTTVQTRCFCSDIIPPNYLTKTPTADDIYMEMAMENDLPW